MFEVVSAYEDTGPHLECTRRCSFKRRRVADDYGFELSLKAWRQTMLTEDFANQDELQQILRHMIDTSQETTNKSDFKSPFKTLADGSETDHGDATLHTPIHLQKGLEARQLANGPCELFVDALNQGFTAQQTPPEDSKDDTFTEDGVQLPNSQGLHDGAAASSTFIEIQPVEYNNGVRAVFTKRLLHRDTDPHAPVMRSDFDAKVMGASIPDGYSLWFHGTTSLSVGYIMRYGIQLDQGREKRDFSTSVRRGFYISSNFIFSRSYCQRRHGCPVSVIVFRLRDEVIASARRGLDLRFRYRVHDEGRRPNWTYLLEPEPDRTKLKEWEKVIRHHRARVFRGDDSIDSQDLIAGPVSDNETGPLLCRPPCDGYQLCVRTDELAGELFRSIVEVVHFTDL